VIPDKIGHSDQLLDAGAGRSGAAQDYRVEYDPPNGQPVVAKSAKSMSRRELAVRVIPVRRAHPHAREAGGTGTFDLIQDVHVGENARCLRAQILGADLVPGKLCSVEHEDIDAFQRQGMRRRRTRRAPTNHYDFRVE
jgi:hypothetical protein